MARKYTATDADETHKMAEAMCAVAAEHSWDEDETAAVMAIAEGLLRSGHNPGAVAGLSATLWEGAKRLYPLIVARHSDSPGVDFSAMVELAEIFQTRGYPFDWNVLEVHETLVRLQNQPEKPSVQPAPQKRRWWNWLKSSV